MPFRKREKLPPVPIGVELTRQDTLALKALAISVIVMHNFLHMVNPTPLENEFTFSVTDGILKLIAIVITIPLETLHAFFGFFGHLGVPVFVFLSGYGLTRSLLSRSTASTRIRDGYRTVVAKQFWKMTKLILVGTLLAVAYRFVTQGSEYDFPADMLALLGFLSMTSNLRSNAWGEFVTIWWFFGLIIQLYWLFPLLVRASETHPNTTLVGAFALLIIAPAVQCVSPSFAESHVLFATPLAHLATFVLGIQSALGRRVLPEMISLCACLFFLAQFSFIFFPVQGVCVALMAVYAYLKTGRSLSRNTRILRIGSMSAFIFLVHGFLREPWTDLLAKLPAESGIAIQGVNPLATLASLILWMVFVYGVAILAEYLCRCLDPKALTETKNSTCAENSMGASLKGKQS